MYAIRSYYVGLELQDEEGFEAAVAGEDLEIVQALVQGLVHGLARALVRADVVRVVGVDHLALEAEDAQVQDVEALQLVVLPDPAGARPLAGDDAGEGV